MSRDNSSGEAAGMLRERAERILRQEGSGLVDPDREDFLRLVHELEVHQVELELQNDELRRIQADLEASRNRFADLYESAPVAYVTLNSQGLVELANRAARELLGKGRGLEGRPFSSLLLKEDLSLYYGYFNRLATHDQTAEPLELRLFRRLEEKAAHVILEAALDSATKAGESRWRITLTDITERKRAEQELEARSKALEQSEARARAEAGRRRRLARRVNELLEEDRRQLAMMLHDEVGQELSGAKIGIENARLQMASADAGAIQWLDKAVEILQNAITHLRDISRRLRPASLDVMGLVPAIRSLAEGTQSGGCRIHLYFGQVPGDLDRNLQTAVFRIAQEAVTNALRHSGCREVHLSLSVREQVLQLNVEDDGCGFAWDEIKSEASGQGPLGLVIMRERAHFAGGELSIDSTPGRGTVVTMEVPLGAFSPSL